MTQAEAQKWCLDRGITPSETEAVRAMSKLSHAEKNGAEAAKLEELTERARVVGIAVGWSND